MKNIFTGLVVITLIAYVVWFCMPLLWEYLYEGDVLNALSWNGYGSQINTNGPIPYIFLVAYGVICIGLINFKRWARTGYVIFTILSILITPFLGLSVQWGIESFLSYVISLGDGAIIAMLFFTNLSDKFESNN
jgi:hypothetical protein